MLRQAADLAGLKLKGMVHENIAAAVEFAQIRKNRDKDSKVMFYNMGAVDTEVTIVQYFANQNKIEILSEAWDSTLGGNAFDQVMEEIMVREFNSGQAKSGEQKLKKAVNSIKKG